MDCKVRVGLSVLHGRGVFAACDIQAGEVAEECPVMVFSQGDGDLLDETFLYGHYFDWGDAGGALALGYGSLYNHSAEPNAYCEADIDHDVLRVVACADIPEGSEVTIAYADEDCLWFEPV